MTNGEKIIAILKPRKDQIRIYGNWVEIEIQKLGINFSCGLDWWNAEYKEPTGSNNLSSGTRKNSKKLEKSTTKNDLAVDCISRDSAIKALDYAIESFEFKSGVSKYMDDIAKLLDTIYEIQVNNIKALPSVTPQEPILDKIFCIVHSLSIMSTPELEHKAIMQIAEMLEPLCLLESEDKE